MSSDSPKHALFAALATLAQALAHEHRLELLDLLAQGERTVDGLAQRTGLSMANASQHLQQLRRAGLVETRRDGRHVYYRLADETGTVALLEGLRLFGERQMAEVQRLFTVHLLGRDALEPVDPDTLLARLREGTATVIDVRPADEYQHGHLPGAVNIPPGALEDHVEHLRRDLPVIAYCRGPYCVFSYDAVARLRSLGFEVRRFETGFPQWKAAGLPVETGAGTSRSPLKKA
jgi:rhodanese-related sulfurtransferase/DNA-binding MarR family transcriptional regulator